MYVVSIKKGNEYHPHSVYSDFKSVKMSVMDLVDTKELVKQIKEFPDDIHINESLYILNDILKIDSVKNRLTSETALNNIKKHIDLRFQKLMDVKNTICFPFEIIDQKTSKSWKELDIINSVNVISYLQKYIKDKIDNLKKMGNDVKVGFVKQNTYDITSVKFTNSIKYKTCDDCFCIIVSPETGYKSV